MSKRIVPAVLIALLLVVHAQLWFGRGSVGNVAALRQKLDEQTASNQRAQQTNERLAAEVRDLKVGYEAIEELARSELGMVKQDEVFFQIVEPPKPDPARAAKAP